MSRMGEELVGMGAADCSWLIRPSIYFLLYQGMVVYIGQSRMPIQRIYAHRSTWGKKKSDEWRRMGKTPVKAVIFDEVFLLKTAMEDLDRVEREMIQKHRPKYNVQHNRGVAIPLELQSLISELMSAPAPAPPPVRIQRRF